MKGDDTIGAERRPEVRNLVAGVAGMLRERVFAGAPDDRLGSLGELAADLGVGIVTIQQAARVLEHEGLLTVRRGPGGGYYGRRPDDASLERALSAWMRMHPDSFHEAIDITSLLFIELCGAAARSGGEALRRDLARLHAEIGDGVDEDGIGPLEARLQDLLFRMVERPIFELLTRVTLSFARNGGRSERLATGGAAGWRAGRLRIVAAILARDEALARFEADRSNRRPLLAALDATGTAQPNAERTGSG